MKKSGLCINCVNNEECMYNKGQNVVQCEEYSEKTGVPNYSHPYIEKRELKEPDRILGICSNCIYRMDCCIRNPDHIIWRCEEYA